LTIYYLDIDQVLTINRKVLTKSEVAGFLYRGGVEYTLDRVRDVYEELPEKDAIIGKGSFLLYEIASHQYFIHGNKRTAFTIADVFLDINDVNFDASLEEKHFVSKAIALKIYNIEDVRQFITKSLK